MKKLALFFLVFISVVAHPAFDDADKALFDSAVAVAPWVMMSGFVPGLLKLREGGSRKDVAKAFSLAPVSVGMGTLGLGAAGYYVARKHNVPIRVVRIARGMDLSLSRYALLLKSAFYANKKETAHFLSKAYNVLFDTQEGSDFFGQLLKEYNRYKGVRKGKKEQFKEALRITDAVHALYYNRFLAQDFDQEAAHSERVLEELFGS